MTFTQDILSHKTIYLESQKEVFDLMANIFHILKKENMRDDLAYCLQNNYMNNQYEVHVNNIYPPAIEPMLVHEYGHILFSHFRGTAQKEQMIRQLLTLNWSSISKYFDPNIKMDIVVKWFASKLNNVLMDYEVNSKLYTKEEFETFLYIVDDLIITYHQNLIKDYPNNKDYFTQYKKIYDRKIKNKDDHLTSLCWPEDNGFPVGLDYESYVVYAIKNLNKFAQDQAKQIMKSLTGNDYSDDDFNTGKISIPKDFILNDTSANEVNKRAGGQSNPAENQSEPHQSKKSTLGRGDIHKSGDYVIQGNDVEAITDFIYKHAFIYEKEKSHRDLIHHYNRGRTRETKTLIGYTRRHRAFRKANVTVLIDVSGSVNEQSVKDVLASLKFLKNDFVENNSHIISWDTDLVHDSYWMDMSVKYSAGGTKLAKGIEYSKKYIKKSYDKLFLISDFEDRLNDWAESFKNFPGEKYGILTSTRQYRQEDLIKLKTKIGFNDLFLYH